MTQCVILHTVLFFTQCVILHSVCVIFGDGTDHQSSCSTVCKTSPNISKEIPSRSFNCHWTFRYSYYDLWILVNACGLIIWSFMIIIIIEILQNSKSLFWVSQTLFKSGVKASLNWPIFRLHTISTAALFEESGWWKIYANGDILVRWGDLTQSHKDLSGPTSINPISLRIRTWQGFWILAWRGFSRFHLCWEMWLLEPA